MTFRTGDGHEVNNILVIDSGGNIQSVPSVAINQAKSAMDATNLKLEVNGNASIRGANALFFGVTTNSYNSWKTKIWNNNTSTMYVNAQEFNVNNAGYGSATFLKANASGVDGTTFRDLDSTSYYLNPASNSVLSTVDIQRLDVNNSGFISFYGNGSEDHSIGSYLDDDIRINSYGAMYISLDSNGNNDSAADFKIVKHAGGSSAWAATDELFKIDGETNAVTIGNSQVDATINALASMVINIDSDNNSTGESFFVKHNANTSGGGSQLLRVTAAGNTEATTSLRAPIFYDSDNTAYYINPGDTTISGKFRQTVIVGDGSQLNSNDGSWGARLNLTDSVHSKIAIGQDTDSMKSHWYTHSGQDSIKFGSTTNHDVEFQRQNVTVLELMANDRVGINIGSHDYTGHSNIDQYILTLNTDYTAEGQNFHFVNHNGNWQDGTSGGDTAYGLMWGYQNLIRAGIHYDHRGIEKFDFYSSYGDIRFRTPASVNGNISPIGSETTMPARLTIAAGGSVTSSVDLRTPILYDTGNTGFFVNPAGSTKLEELNIHGGNNQATDDATLYVNKTNNNDWLIKAEGTSSATEYGISVRMPGTHSMAYHATNAGTEYYKVGTDMVLHNASIRSPIFYDSNNTAYYLDASSTGTSLNVAGNAIIPGYASIAGVELSSGDHTSFNNITNDGWVTICDFAGSRKADIIEIYENESSRHNYVKLEVSWSYGQGSINVINGVRHGNHTMLKVRMLYNSADRTYGTGKLQVYMYNWSTSMTLKLKQLGFGRQGWGRATLKTSAENGTPSGYTEHEDSVMNIIEDPNGAFGSTGRVTAGGGIDVYNGSPIKFHTASGDGTSTERGFIDAQEGGHLRIATSGGENIVFQDGGVGGTTNLTILGSGEMVKEATERFTIKSHTNSWDGGMRFYASDNSTIFQMHPDTNGQMYVDREWRFQNSQINYGPIKRGSHHTGHLEGSYNNIGANGSKSNPIYTIGSSYNPSDAALGNMYGIGFSDKGGSPSFFPSSFQGGWGMYVAADGDARVFLDGSNGHGTFIGQVRATGFYDVDNTTYYLDPGVGTTALYTNGAWKQTSTNWSGEAPGKMQYHGSNWYLQATNNFIFRNASGVNVLETESNGRTTLTEDLRLSAGANLTRLAHYSGHLEGSYNNVGGNGSKSNPIYTIGSSYNPDTNGTTLANMYGIGYTNVAASFISSPINVGDWGMYVAADGDARIWLDGSQGHAAFLGNIRSTAIYDHADTSYYFDGNDATCSLKTRGSIRIGYGGHLGLGAIGIPKLAIPGDTAAWSGSGTTTGQVVITLPGTLANYDMMYFEVDVYEYSGKNATKIIVGGHNWNSGGNSGTSNQMWHNVGVKIIGNMDKSVFFGWRNDGTNNRRVMVIGSPTSSWSYGTVRVSSVSGATDFYSGSIDYTADWNVTQSTSSSYYTKSPTTDFNTADSVILKGYGAAQHNRYYAVADMRSPIYYDSNNTSYYINPDSGTSLNVAGHGIFGGDVQSNRYDDQGGTFLFKTGSGSGRTRHLNLADTSNDPAGVSDSNNPTGISWGTRSDNNGYYMLGLKGQYNNGLSTHSRLAVAWHTGVEIGGSPTYGGTRFFNDSPFVTTTEIMSVGKGDSHVRVINNLHAAAYYDINSSSYYVHPGDTTSANLYGDIKVVGNYGHGLVGLYSSTKYQHVWSMGAAYRSAADGSGFGNMYGLTYTHTNVGTGTNQSISGLSHQLQHRHNGTLTAAIGSGIWTSGNVTAYSDIAVKRNLEVIPDALNKVCQINGYTYERTDYVKDEEDPNAPDILRQAGVVAQEVEKVLPEVVSGEEGNKAVAYGNMVSILIEAIKELKSEVDDLKEQLKNK